MPRFSGTPIGPRFSGEPIEESTQQNLHSAVANVYPDVEEDRETVERLKTVQYLSKKGYNVSVDNVDDYKEHLFGAGNSYEGINKVLSSQLAVESTGEQKSSAKVKPSYLAKGFVSRMAQAIPSTGKGITAIDMWETTRWADE